MLAGVTVGQRVIDWIVLHPISGASHAGFLEAF
jgi:hypothetical protein